MRLPIIALLAVFGTDLQAQLPGTRLAVGVQVNIIVLRGDTTSVAYVLSNGADSQDSLFTFIVDAPARVSYIPRPQPDSIWMVDSLIHETEPAAFWSKLDLLPPSSSTVPISFESVGLPGVVSDWVQGHWPIPTCCDDDSAGSGEDIFVTRTIQGKTVGVEPWPLDRSAQALLARLRTLTQTSCASPLLWITDTGLCGQLVTDLDSAEAYRASGAYAQARTTMDQYSALLNGPDPGTFASGVTSPAFWLLKSNGDIVKSAF
jgi:hypothetical protein